MSNVSAHARSMNFWYEFDDHFLNHPPQEVLNAYTGLFNSQLNHGAFTLPQGMDRLFLLLGSYLGNPQKDELYRNTLLPVKPYVKILTEHQIELMHAHFSNDEELRLSFELFGQGVLYDQRRPNNPVHQMDGRFAGDIVGYPRWHAFIRAAVLMDANSNFMLQIDRYLCLAFFIQSELHPDATSNNNKPMEPDRLNQLRSLCLGMNSDELDERFLSNPSREKIMI